MRKTYSIIKEPRRTIYFKLLYYSLKTCTSFLLVIRPTVAIKNSAKIVIDELKPYLIEKNVQSEWPGTKLLEGEALVYYFQLNEKSTEVLSHVSEKLYSWLHPDLPEDLCLLRENGDPWLVTISHEKDAYLLLSVEEKDNLCLEVPELVVKED